MKTFEPEKYGPICAAILDLPTTWALGPATPTAAARPMLSGLSAETMFPDTTVRDQGMVQCCISGLWLLHNYLDESHSISQHISSPSGSYWHAIMHRREPDYSNAKYWFRQVGHHPLFAPLALRVRQIASQRPLDPQAAFLVEQNEWDAFRFVDLCESAASGRSAHEPVCLEVARVEWELLFDYCYREAMGDSRDEGSQIQ